jgi:hypothetical protein
MRSGMVTSRYAEDSVLTIQVQRYGHQPMRKRGENGYP